MSRTKTTVLILIGILVIGLTPYPGQMRGQCGGELSVTVTVQTPPRWVICGAMHSEKVAQEFLNHPHPEEFIDSSAKQFPFSGEPMLLRLKYGCMGYQALLWRHLVTYPARFLAVQIGYDDGRREEKIVSIPHLDECSSVTVEFP